MNKALGVVATRILALLLAAMLLLSSTGCLPLLLFSAADGYQKSTSEQREIVYNVQGEFNDLSYEELCAVYFEHEVTRDNLSLNQLVANPEALEIEAPRPATLGDFTLEATQEDNQFYSEVLEALTGNHTITSSKLSGAQQLESESIEKTLKQELRYEEFFYYYEPLSPSTGVQASLPLNLMDYSFRAVDDIEIYLELLEDVPRCFDQLLAYEEEKKEKSLLMASEAMEDTIEQARAYTGEPDTHILVTAFDEILDAAVVASASSESNGEGLAALTAEDVQEYKQRNLEKIRDAVVPSYKKLVSGLESLLPDCKEGTRLYDYARGTEYYELQMESMGFVEGAQSAAATLDTALEEYWSILASNSSSLSEEGIISESVIALIGDSPEDYIAYVQEHSGGEFASAGSLNYEVKEAPEASPNDYAMAYFMIPPVDDPQKNTIVFFPRNIADEVELFSTMAHEGYPGHMYQVYAYSLENPSNISKVLGSLAYMEGWAMYAQAQAMRYLDTDPYAIEATIAYEKFVYGLQARVDVGINFEGWSVSDTEDYLAGWGFESAAESLYEVSIQQPVSYLPYGLGVIEFDALRAQAQTELDDSFDAATFHQKLTSLGPVSFDTLEREFESWLRSSDAELV